MGKKGTPRYSSVEIGIRVIQCLVQFTLYHSVACLITGIGGTESREMYLRMGILLLPLFLYLLVRMYVGNLFLFALLHIGCAGGLLLFFPRTHGEAAAILLCLLVMMVNSLRVRLIGPYRGNECPSLIRIAFIFIVYVFAAYADRVLLMKLYFYELIGFLFFYMISKNLENTEKFINQNLETANFPIRQIKGVNRTLLCFFAVVMLGGMLLTPQLHPERMASQLGHIALIVLRWLFSLIRTKELSPEPLLDLENSENMGEGLLLEEAVPSKLALILQFMMEVISVIVLIGLLLFGIGFSLYQIYKRFYENPLKTGEEEKKMDVITRTEHVPIFRKKKELQEESGGYSKKIRRHYKKSVKRRTGKEQILSPSLTPTEIESALGSPLMDGTEQERVIVLYEKARYGKEECTKEELEEIRKIL